MGDLSRVSWALLQLSSGVAAFWVGTRLWSWGMAEPIRRAPAAALAVLPMDCPAFRAEHGTYFCEKLGVTYDHPVLLSASALLFVVFAATTLYLDASGRGVSALFDSARRKTASGR